MMRPRPAPAAAIALLATAVYAVMWIGYRHGWGWLARMDWSFLNGTRDLAVKHPSWLRAAEVVSVVLGPGTLAVLGIAVTLCAVVLRRLRAALALALACAPCNELVTAGAKALVDRPRPPTALVGAASTSFPSGHALEATAGLLAMTLFALPMLNRVLRGLLVAAVAVALPAVGLSRVMLNVHYPSDVLAGWSLGYLYFLLCLLVFRPSAPDRSG
ncbi:phosphatase PAP2 family protein [Mycobacterium avium]|uniref:phosphatase PAP2 family protein n=1 Tax=Mycobacterium avium TaxID=1764 RepID=UPI000EAFA4D8|nr:phosphatase PAP2 family protein [Mycobacterium avium]AYJ07107.1 phosphatase PAP2 family protein [Mycobacterium avium]